MESLDDPMNEGCKCMKPTSPDLCVTPRRTLRPAERARLQSPEPLAAARAPGAYRQVVADQSPAAPRQDGWAAGHVRPVLLVDVGRESSDAAAVRVDAPTDLGAAGAHRLTDDGGRARPLGQREGATRERCPTNVGGRMLCRPKSRPARRGREVPPRRQEDSTKEKSSRCSTGPIFGSQIGNVGQTTVPSCICNATLTLLFVPLRREHYRGLSPNGDPTVPRLTARS